MSTVILAVFPDHATADRVRMKLVQDGFPTDRVELTAAQELGRAALLPAQSPHSKCVQYFSTVLAREDEQHYAEMFAQRIENGAATITVHPRGARETNRATEIIQQAHPADMVGHDLTKHGWERAAAKNSGYWIQHVWLEASPDTDCIYCRLFPSKTHSH